MARFVLFLLFAFSTPAWTQCISISDAPKHIGKKTCVAGKVLEVRETDGGAFVLSFCAREADLCPFSVRVFPLDFDYVGDVTRLAGKEVEITGKIKEKNHQAEIVLKDADQLSNSMAKLPPIPKTYDVERRGNVSPGQFKGGKSAKRSHKRESSSPSTEIDDE